MITDEDRRLLAAGPPTLSVIKALDLLGSRVPDPDTVCARVLASWPATGVLDLAGHVLSLHALGAGTELAARVEPALARMAADATSREEHFMTIAVVDECGLGAFPARSVAFFRALEHEDGTFGPDPLQNAIAASALLRAGAPLRDPSAVGKLLLDHALGGDLWTAYCAMRALDLLDCAPWVPLERPALPTADAVYQWLSIVDWQNRPVFAAARDGDTATLARFLGEGGDPDRTDARGWTLLATAAVRGRADAVSLLLEHGADPDLRTAGTVPVLWAGQAGDIDTVRVLLDRRPDHLHVTCPVNGHTVLLQAVFYGTARHRALIAHLLERATPQDRRRMLTACNVRGYTALTMAKLWNLGDIADLLSTVDSGTAAERNAYRRELLAAIAPADPDPATEALVAAVANPLDEAGIAAALNAPGLDLNRRGGPLSQTPVIAALTGTDPTPAAAAARLRVVRRLLELGADPDLPELHPMGVDAVIRAAVLNHFACLRAIAGHMPPLAFAAALNERPAVNGQTALDDTVHRALTAAPAALDDHLEQIRWCVAHGARTDIADHTGVSPAGRARAALADPALHDRAVVVLAALDGPTTSMERDGTSTH